MSFHANVFRRDRAVSSGLGALAALLALSSIAAATAYQQNNLTSDLQGVAAHRDSLLMNPWGIAFSPTSPVWISDNHAGVSTVYDGTGQSVPAGHPRIVTIPPPSGGNPPAAPDGIVFNGTQSFQVAPGDPALFIFATEDGTISGWNRNADSTAAILEVDLSANNDVFKGLAIGSVNGNPAIYATDFHNGAVDAFDGTFSPILQGAFVDPNIPAGYAPFGIENVSGELLVTYAMQDSARHDDVPGPGHGYVDVYDMSGNLMQRLISQGVLDSPWGIAVAPAGFGDFAGDLLIGDFGDGKVNAFDPTNGSYLGTLSNQQNHPLINQGLWGLAFGNGSAGTDPNTLYVTAGIPGDGQLEDHGLFAAISVAQPTPVFLASFDAAAEDQGVLLRWRIYSDVGNPGFQVDRSADRTTWEQLTQTPVVPASGSSYEYLDRTAAAGSSYEYAIEPVGVRGQSGRFGPVQVTVPLPGGISLRVRPSPTAAATTVDFSLPKAGVVRIGAFDAAGREVAIVASGAFAAGNHSLAWGGADGAGRPLPGGIYFLKMQTDAGARTVPLTLLR